MLDNLTDKPTNQQTNQSRNNLFGGGIDCLIDVVCYCICISLCSKLFIDRCQYSTLYVSRTFQFHAHIFALVLLFVFSIHIYEPAT